MDDHAGGSRRVGFLADTHSAKGGRERPPRRSPGAVSPGSTWWCPSLPRPGSPGAVAVLDLVGGVPEVDLVTIVPAG
jgi:hypothetical protein